MHDSDHSVPDARHSGPPAFPAQASKAQAAKTQAAKTEGGAYAAIDLGTNNCRLLVGAPTGDGFRVLDSFSRTVRLGEGLDETGMLGEAAMDRAIAALRGCAQRLERRPIRALRAVATEACRRAGNGAAFLARASRNRPADRDDLDA